MKTSLCLSVLSWSILASVLLSAPAAFASIAPKCEAKITYHLRTGIIEETKLRLHAKSKTDCQKKARTARVYSAPTNVARKIVAVNWKPKK